MERVIRDPADLRTALRWSLNASDRSPHVLGKLCEASGRLRRNAVVSFFSAGGDNPAPSAHANPHLSSAIVMVELAGLELVVRPKSTGPGGG